MEKQINFTTIAMIKIDSLIITKRMPSVGVVVKHDIMK